MTEPLDSKIATLGFTYKPGLKMDEQDRIENPLGFQVTSYRVDNDYAAMPPLERPAVHLEAAPVEESEAARAGAVAVESADGAPGAVSTASGEGSGE